MEPGEVIARARANEDEVMVRAAHRWVLVHFGGDVQRAAWFFDELAGQE